MADSAQPSTMSPWRLAFLLQPGELLLPHEAQHSLVQLGPFSFFCLLECCTCEMAVGVVVGPL